MQIAGDALAVGDHVQFAHPALGAGQLPGHRRLVGERGGHPELVGGELPGSVPAQRHHHPGRGVGGPQRQHQGRPGAGHQALGPRQGGDPAGGAFSERRADLVVGHADRAGRCRRSGGFDHHQFVDIGVLVRRDRDHHCVGSGQSQRLVGDQPEHPGGFGPGEQFGGDVPGGLDPGLSRARLLVEPGVGDGDAGGGGQRLDEHLVVLAERLAPGLLGQIEIAVDLVADAHRDAEEGAHRGMIAREPDRGRVHPDVVEADRLRVVDEQAEHTASRWRSADPLADLVVDSLGDEFDQCVPVAAAHPERTVAGVDQAGGGANDGPQGGVQIEPRVDH